MNFYEHRHEHRYMTTLGVLISSSNLSWVAFLLPSGTSCYAVIFTELLVPALAIGARVRTLNASRTGGSTH